MSRLKRIAVAALLVFSISGAIAQPKPGKPKELAPAVQIYFDLNKSEVKKAEKAKLDKLIEDLKAKKEYRIVLTGHTDSLGSSSYNMELSEARVDHVYEYLVEKGVDTTVLQKSYFGASKPREGNEDEEKRSKNRRVEITIIEKPKPVEKPKPKPVVRDTCNHDTTVFVGEGISITMNVCEYQRMCKGKGPECIEVSRKSSIDEIFESGTPLRSAKGEGFIWAGIFDFKFPIDTCFKPANYTFTLDLETFKKAKLQVMMDKNGSLDLDKASRIRISRTKTEIKITVPIKCSGVKIVAAPAGKNKISKFKDKTGTIDEIYVVTTEPVAIIPATKTGSTWFVNYGSLTNAKLYIKLKDGETIIQDVDLNKIRKQKKKGELRKKYKIKAKHLKGA